MSKKPPKEKPTLLSQLSSLCDDHSSFQARVAIASFSETSSSTFLDQVLMFFEHIQVISPILILTITLNFNFHSSLFQATLFLLRIISPALWMSFDKTGVLENSVLILVCCFTAFKFLLFLYILYQCTQKTEASGLLVTLWRIMTKFQSRIGYMYVSTFYINSIRVINWETFESTDDQNKAFEVIAFLLIAIEFILAFAPKMVFHYMLPTKSFLAAKGNTLEIMTLLQKVVVQVLLAALDYKSPASNWIFAISNICIDSLRISYFYRVLPLYSFRALYFQGWFLMVVACLNLSFFMSVIVKTIDESYCSLSFSLILWGVLLVLAIFTSNNFLKMAFWRLICDPSLDNPNLLVHRIVAIKELRRLTEEHYEKNEKYDFHFLVNQTLNRHLEKILWVQEWKAGDNLDINTKESSNIMFKNFLEKLSERSPRNKFIKIFLAEFCFKTMKVFRDPIRTCLALRKTRDINLRINAEFLLMRIQNHIKLNNEISPLNLFAFASQHALTAQLKQEMLKQANLQIEVSSEIMEDAPNLELIYLKSQQAHYHRRNAIRRINHIPKALSGWNIEALLVSAKYYLSINHSIKDYLYFKKIYLQKLNKYQESFSQEKLCPEDVFQDTTGFLLVSGEKGEEGKILFATNPVVKALGGESSQYPGTYFVQKTPPIYRPIYSVAWKQMPEDPESTYMGKIIRNFAYNMNGYLVEAEYYIGIHPFASQGFGFIFIFRPIFSNKQYMLLHENGDIDSTTKGLLERFGLKPQSMRTNIRMLNEELEMVNDAFNMMAFPEKYDVESLRNFLSKEEAEEIYKKYTTEGVDIMFNSENGMNYSYNCKIHNLLLGPLLIKTVTLEENRRENRERTHELQPLFYQNQKEEEALDNLSSNSLKTEEEKEEGWVDFDAITAAKKTPSEIQQTPFSSQTEVEILNKTQREEPEAATTRRQLMTSRTTLKRLEYKSTAKLAAVHLSDSMNEEPEFAEEEERHKVIPKSSLRSKNSSRFGQQKRLATVFHASLDTKYYTKTFWALVSLFYASLAVMIALRIVVKLTIDKDMSALAAKKDIFNNNSLRGYQLIETAGMTRLGYQIYINQFDLSVYGNSYEDSYNAIRTLVLMNIKSLRESNKVVFEESNVLNEETQNALYAKDAKIYTTYFDETVQSYTKMDTFQATDRIIESALYLYEAFSNVLFNSTFVDPEAETRAKFLFRNSLNDLIIANLGLSMAMLESYSQQFDSVKNLSLAFTIIMIVFLCGFAGAFFIVLHRQYSKDIFYLSAICRLNHGKLQLIHQEFLHFQKKLKQEEGGKDLQEKAQKLRHAKTRDENLLSSSIKRESLKVPEKKEIRKRYYIYILGIAVLLLALLSYVIYNQASAGGIFDKMDANKERLYFVNKIRIKISLTSASFKELASTNNVAMVENVQVLTKFEELIKVLKSLRVGIYSTLLTGESLEESPEIEALLLGDGCSMLQWSLSPMCASLKNKGMPTGFIYLLNEFEGYMTDKLEAYKASNKTTAALVELQVKDYDIISYIYVVTLNEVELLASIVNEQYEEKMDADTNRRLMSLVGVLLIIFGVGIFGWIFVLKKLGESVNNFKNILRVLPAELVLSSFILKTALMRSSKGVLDQVKNEI